MRKRIGLFAAVLVATPLLAHAQALRPRVVGTVSSVDGTTLHIRTANGEDATVALTPSTRYAESKRMSLSNIDKNSFLGIAAKNGPDGKLVAVQIVIFPEAMRGVGEGHRPWYALPNVPSTSMTNGTVASAPTVQTSMTNGTVATTQSGNSPELTVTYKGGQQQVLVPPTASIVTIAPGTVADLTKGAPVAVTEDDAGKTAVSVSIGVGGVTPM